MCTEHEDKCMDTYLQAQKDIWSGYLFLLQMGRGRKKNDNSAICFTPQKTCGIV